MNITWVTIRDDDLRFVDKAVNFLQIEFCPPDAPPFWSAEYFRWKLGTENPAGAGYVSMAMVGETVVGIVSLTKKRLWINGEMTIGGEVGDAYTSMKMRRRAKPAELSELDPDPDSFLNRSIFGRLASDVRARAEADAITAIYGTPNHNAYPGWTKRLGYFEHKSYHNQSFSRPTWRLVIKRYPEFSAIAGVLKMLDRSLVSVHAWLWRVVKTRFAFDRRLPTDQEIDALWSQTKPATGFSLVRDATYWRHRYMTHPLAEYALCCVRYDGVLVSIVAVRLACLDGSRPVLSLVEWMSDEQLAFGYLLSQTLHAFRDDNIDVFSMWANASGAEARAARLSLFSKRARVPVILADSAAGRKIGKMSDEFLFFLGSTDAV